MPRNLEGKVAIVTGVSHDGQVGQAVAKALAAQGASLAICARTKDNVVARAAELKAEGRQRHSRRRLADRRGRREAPRQ